MTITKTLLRKDRPNILMNYFGSLFLTVELTTFSLADYFIDEYHGGSWSFFSLSNGGFYMAFKHEGNVTFNNQNNLFCESIDPEIASIIINLYAISAVVSESRDKNLQKRYQQLYQYAMELPEAKLIYRALD